MEQDSNNHTVLCKMGCGFFGNHSFEGMCSKCYKENVKRQQQSSPTAGRASPGTGACGTTSASQLNLQSPTNPSLMPSVLPPQVVSPPVNIPSTPEKPSSSLADEDTSSPSSLTGSTDDSISDSPGKIKKRNRCFNCRKKVGLTGFECRCGGLFCGLHRYSDKHNCTYDYKADGREQIAKANPVIVGEKVKKI